MHGHDFPLLSVIVPIYNVQDFIDKCIRSIVNQTYPNLEIILVDDGSTDNSGHICDEWKRANGRIQVIHKENGGLVSARQAGIRKANGKYISQIDGDDWIEPMMYERMMELAIGHDADVITSGFIRDYATHSIDLKENTIPGVYRGKALKDKLLSSMIDTQIFFRANITPSIANKIFKRELISKYQLCLSPQVSIGEDSAVVYPSMLDADCVVVSGENYYHYVMRPNSVMGQRQNEADGLRDIKQILETTISQHESEIINLRKQFDVLKTYINIFCDLKDVVHIKEEKVYPFDNLRVTDRVIIYGAGRFGVRLKQYFQDLGICNVIAIVDRVGGQGITPLRLALSMEFDKIILAILVAGVASEVKELLLSEGIDEEKLAVVDIEKIC